MKTAKKCRRTNNHNASAAVVVTGGVKQVFLYVGMHGGQQYILFSMRVGLLDRVPGYCSLRLLSERSGRSSSTTPGTSFYREENHLRGGGVSRPYGGNGNSIQ